MNPFVRGYFIVCVSGEPKRIRHLQGWDHSTDLYFLIFSLILRHEIF